MLREKGKKNPWERKRHEENLLSIEGLHKNIKGAGSKKKAPTVKRGK